jgi:DNA-binding transcriptional MerR regulator
MPRPARFTIRAASALTGINPNTLRAWERRYGLVRPERTPKGYRLYTDRDIERLRSIQRALQKGIPVSRAGEHLDDLEPAPGAEAMGAPEESRPAVNPRLVEVSLGQAGLVGTTTIRLPSRAGRDTARHSLADFSEQIEMAATRFDRPWLDRAFSRAVGLFSLRQAFQHALAPALTRVGERYLRHPEGIAEEHFLTAFAREKLHAALAGLRPLHQHPRAVFACVPGEQHEIMLMRLALEVGLEGISTLYLGADTPVEAIVHATRDSGVRAVALSATIRVPHEAIAAIHDQLLKLPRRPRLLVGGPAATRSRDWLEREGCEVLSLDAEEAARRVLRAIASR